MQNPVMQRIAMVTPILPVPFEPTRGRFMLETARALSRQAQVRVFLLQSRYYEFFNLLSPRASINGKVPDSYRIDGLDMETINYPAIPVLSRALNPLLASARLTPRVAAFAPELVLGYWLYPDGYAAQRSAKALNRPCVLGALGSDVHVRSGLNRFMTRRAVRRADAITAVSAPMKQHIVEQFDGDATRITTILNGYDHSVFHPRDQTEMRAELKIDAGAPVILYVGRLVAAKGLMELLSAFAQIRSTSDHAQLILIGEGRFRADLEGRAQSLGLSESVRFAGGKTPEEVARFMAAADVITLPSWSEGHPNVVVEAQACGRPVVATRVGGIPHMINANNGVLVTARDAISLRDGIRQALQVPWNHSVISQSSQRSWDDVATETLAVTKQALARYESAVLTAK